jgi:hypothetical protein
VVASETDSLAAARAALDYRERGYDAFLIPREDADDGNRRVGIGQFPGRAEALAARPALPDDVPGDAWLLELPAVAPPELTAGAGASADPAAPDSVAAVTDTLDGERAAPRGVQNLAANDSLAADSSVAAPDSALTASDSPRVVSDSTVTTATAADSLSAPPEEAWLETLYASVESDFPGTPFAERARSLREALDAMRTGDASGAEGGAGSGAQADSLRRAEEALRGAAPIDALKGTHTWSIYTSLAREWAEAILLFTNEAGYRTALYAEGDEGNPTYHVLVGQFATEEAAEAARPEVESIPDAQEPRLLELPPGAALEQSGDVLQRGGQ